MCVYSFRTVVVLSHFDQLRMRMYSCMKIEVFVILDGCRCVSNDVVRLVYGSKLMKDLTVEISIWRLRLGSKVLNSK